MAASFLAVACGTTSAPLNPAYRCVTFRSGSWCIAPSDFILDLLAQEGVVLDMSVVPGVAFKNARIEVNFTVCEESFWPWYPDMGDARRLGTPDAPIVCFPTFSLPRSVPEKILGAFAGAILGRKHLRPNQAPRTPAGAAHAASSTRSPAAEDDYTVWRKSLL